MFAMKLLEQSLDRIQLRKDPAIFEDPELRLKNCDQMTAPSAIADFAFQKSGPRHELWHTHSEFRFGHKQNQAFFDAALFERFQSCSVRPAGRRHIQNYAASDG